MALTMASPMLIYGHSGNDQTTIDLSMPAANCEPRGSVVTS
jgi:hypothetical protein